MDNSISLVCLVAFYSNCQEIYTSNVYFKDDKDSINEFKSENKNFIILEFETSFWFETQYLFTKKD